MSRRPLDERNGTHGVEHSHKHLVGGGVIPWLVILVVIGQIAGSVNDDSGRSSTRSLVVAVLGSTNAFGLYSTLLRRAIKVRARMQV